MPWADSAGKWPTQYWLMNPWALAVLLFSGDKIRFCHPKIR